MQCIFLMFLIKSKSPNPSLAGVILSSHFLD